MWPRPLTYLAFLVSFLVWSLLVVPPPVRSAVERPIAVLVVGDQNGAILTRREKELFRLLSGLRARAGLSKSDLPIISYHYDKDDERNYCEKGLGIKRANLLFVGLVEHEKRVPQRVIYRINNVVDPAAATDKIMAEVVNRLGLDPSVLLEAPSPSATPSALPSAAPAGEPSTAPASPAPTPYAIPSSLIPKPRPSQSPQPTPKPKPLGVTLLKLVPVDYQGTPKRRFLTTDRGVYVNAFLHNDTPTLDQRHTLSVRLLDPSGEPYGRPMGGTFTLVAGERIDQTDMVRRSDPDRHNGYLINGNALGQKPGTYRILLEIDGQIVGKAEFEIVPAE